MFSFKDIFQDKTRILFVAAHPDDVDVFFGGLLCLLNREKKETFVLITTNGGRGSKENKISEVELAAIRLEEEKQALSILGQDPTRVLLLHHLDGEIENNLELIGEISAVIRKFKPEIVCTHDAATPYFTFRDSDFAYINHRDHRNTGLSALDAVYPFSRDRAFFPEQFTQPWSLQNVLLTGESKVNTKIDISAVAEFKKRALLAHKSQFDAETVDSIMEADKEDEKLFETGNYLKLPW